MIVRFWTWHAGLTRRERLLVMLAGAMTSLVVLVYGIVLPLGAAYDDAVLRRDTAVERSGRIEAGLAALDDGARGRAQVGDIAAAIAASAASRDLPVQAAPAGPGGAVTVSVQGAGASNIIAWIEVLAGQGVPPDSLTITSANGGGASAAATFGGAAP